MNEIREKILETILLIPLEDWKHKDGYPDHVIFRECKITIVTRYMNYTHYGLNIDNESFFSSENDTRVRDYIEKLKSYIGKKHSKIKDTELEKIYDKLIAKYE